MHATTALLVAAALFGAALSVPMPSSSEESDEGIAQLPKAELRKLHDSCVKDLGLTPDDKKNPETKGKILACMFMKDGTMTEDGMFSPEGTVANAVTLLKGNTEEVAKVKEMATECGRTLTGVKAPKEEMAEKIFKCFHEFHGKQAA
ncbi:Germin-like protein subfamily T member 3 [Frankliniella fusca]|uniref:Germin-like protein subfamily T member 3 n=1 Tax=Frankliniella fusca TaxID=407009 RepID=A0AAE1HBX0_9NEOP|nr:Germin-like protein subfamily T member 3 [Frankliniella fusca]